MDSRDFVTHLQICGWNGVPVGTSFFGRPFLISARRAVHEIENTGRTSTRGRSLRKAALVPAAAIAVLAFAAPAHAGKPVHPPAAPPPPTPVAPVDDSVSTIPETVPAVLETPETEAADLAVEAAATSPSAREPAPVDEPAKVEAPVEVSAPQPSVQKPKAPANTGSWVRVRTVRPQPVVRSSEPERVAISPSRPVNRVGAPVARRHVHHPARHAAQRSKIRWYQVPAAQYQRSTDRAVNSGSKVPPARAQNPPARTHNAPATDRKAPSRASIRVRGKPPNGTWFCAQRAAECLDSCADNAGWKVVWNGRWIFGCKSPNAARHTLEEVRRWDSDRGVDRGASEFGGKPGPQYQCPGAQYHDFWCDEDLGESPTPPLDVGDSELDDETDVDTHLPDDELTSSCPDTAQSVAEDDPDVAAGGWEKPWHMSCEDTSDTPMTPGSGAQPPTGKPLPTAQVPQPPAPPELPAPAEVPPAQPPTQEPAVPSPAEQPSAPPPPDSQPSTEAPPPAEPAPTPSVPPADAVPNKAREERVGVRPPERNPTRVQDRAAVVVQPSSHVVQQAAANRSARASTKPKPAASKPREAKKSQRRQSRPTTPVTRPATDRSALRPSRASRPIASASKPLDNWLLLLVLTLFGLSLLAFALAAVTEVDGGTAALTKMRARLGSKGLSARRVGLDAGDDGAASAQAPDAIRYRD